MDESRILSDGTILPPALEDEDAVIHMLDEWGEHVFTEDEKARLLKGERVYWEGELSYSRGVGYPVYFVLLYDSDTEAYEVCCRIDRPFYHKFDTSWLTEDVPEVVKFDPDADPDDTPFA